MEYKKGLCKLNIKYNATWSILREENDIFSIIIKLGKCVSNTHVMEFSISSAWKAFYSPSTLSLHLINSRTPLLLGILSQPSKHSYVLPVVLFTICMLFINIFILSLFSWIITYLKIKTLFVIFTISLILNLGTDINIW